MAFGLDPLVKGRGATGKALVAVFATSMVAAATTVGAVLGAAGSRLVGSHTLSVLTGVALAGIMLEAKILPVTPPQRNWLVPRDWPTRFGKVGGYALWGAVLGVGMLSYVPFASYHVFLTCVFLSGSADAGALLGALYGLGRALASVVPAIVAARNPSRRRDLAAVALDHESLLRGTQVAALFGMTIVFAVVASVGTGGWT
jgi:hypothetical protein